MLHALCKGLPAHFSSAFDLVCSLPPLPLCRGVSDKTHVSFRTRSAAAAERSKKHTKSSEVPAPPYCSRKVGFPRQFGGQGGKRRSAASGGKSEALSRQRRDWRARRSAGIALPQRWISPHGLGVPKGIFSSTKRISPLFCRGAAARGHRCRPARLRGALPFRASVRAPSSASGPSSCAPIGNSESCCKSSVWSRRKRM